MIKGLGTDIIEIARIESSISRLKQRFINKLFTAKEQEYCNRHALNAVHYAGRFAAKEAIVKALGTGFRSGITWTDIEILPDDKGKPVVYLSSHLNTLYQDPLILVSISHCKQYAMATAIWT